MKEGMEYGPSKPDKNKLKEKIFDVADRLNVISAGFEKDASNITEDTFTRIEDFAHSVEDLKSLHIAENINSLLSDKAVETNDTEHIDTIMLGSRMVDILDASIKQLAPLIDQLRARLKEVRLDYDIKKSTGADKNAVLPEEVLAAFTFEAKKLASGLSLLREMLSMDFNAYDGAGEENLDEDFERLEKEREKKMLDEMSAQNERDYQEYAAESREQARKIEKLLHKTEPYVVKEFSLLKNSMGFPLSALYMTHAFPNPASETEFSGVSMFDSGEDTPVSMREVNYSGRYDPQKDVLIEVTFTNKGSGKTFSYKP